MRPSLSRQQCNYASAAGNSPGHAPYFGEHFGNASSIHHHGQETRAAVEHARESVGPN